MVISKNRHVIFGYHHVRKPIHKNVDTISTGYASYFLSYDLLHWTGIGCWGILYHSFVRMTRACDLSFLTLLHKQY